MASLLHLLRDQRCCSRQAAPSALNCTGCEQSLGWPGWAYNVEINFDVAANLKGCQVVAIYITPGLTDSEFCPSASGIFLQKVQHRCHSITVLHVPFCWTLELSPKYFIVIKPHSGLRIKPLCEMPPKCFHLIIHHWSAHSLLLIETALSDESFYKTIIFEK